jgi:hypothetical protein
MSVVVGIQHNGIVYVGADSQSTGGSGDQYTRLDKKIFLSCGYIMGVVGSSRIAQLLKTATNIPQLPATLKSATEAELDGTKLFEAEKFFVTKFVPHLKQLFTDFGTEHDADDASDILVAIGPWMVVIETDWQVGIYADKYIAIGSGSGPSLGSLASTENVDPEQRLHLALQASAKHTNTVSAPFYMLITSGGRQKKLPK